MALHRMRRFAPLQRWNDLRLTTRVTTGFGMAAAMMLAAVFSQALVIFQLADTNPSLAWSALIRAAILLGLGVGLAALLVIRLVRNVSAPLARVSKSIATITTREMPKFVSALKRLAAGELNASFDALHYLHLDGEAGDEIGDLVRSHNSLVDALEAIAGEYRGVITHFGGLISGVSSSTSDIERVGSDVSRASTHSLNASREISTAVTELAKGAKLQSDRIYDTRVSSEEMSRAAAQIAQGAVDQAHAVQSASDDVRATHDALGHLGETGHRLARSASSAAAEAEKGLSAGQLTAATLENISRESDAAHSAIEALVQRTEAVSGIVETITEIADQTNLLALNAAIEAARAGEHGRGFAVVASEIRKLAERARTSTSEIEALLSMIRSETGSTATILRSSNDSMSLGLERARATTAALDTAHAALVDTVERAQVVQENVAALLETSERLSTDMQSVLRIVDVNAAAAQELHATCDFIEQAMLDLSSSAEEQATAAEQMAASAASVAEEMEQMEHSAGVITMRSSNISFLMGNFTLTPIPQPAVAALN